MLVAYTTEDDTFGDEDDLLAYLCAVDGLVMLAFGQLLLRRSLPREAHLPIAASVMAKGSVVATVLSFFACMNDL